MASMWARVLVFAALLGVLAFTSSRATAREQNAQLFVEWHGSWWPAKVIAREKTGTRVHYVGWGAEWDESVDATRMKRRDADGNVFVAWGGSFWPATIVGRQRDGLLIHYEGWGTEWDETVSPDRVIRLR